MVFISFRLGHNKLLLPFKGKPLIAHAVDTLLASSVDEIIVVLGHEADRVRAAIGERRVRFVENCNYHEGLGSSVHAGFAAVLQLWRLDLISGLLRARLKSLVILPTYAP
jgi:CTP:molybdopterin cytidylyltransferase MocA